MKKIHVIGKTDVIINLNKIGVPIRGKSNAVLNVSNQEQENELMGLVRAGLLEIIEDQQSIPKVTSIQTLSVNEKTDKKPTNIEEKFKPSVEKKKGRPKGSKNKSNKQNNTKKSFAEEERERVERAEAETQKMGSRVVIGTSDGPKEGKMRRSFVNEIADSEKTRESIEAMEKLEKEEKEEINLPDTPIDEGKLDASEQMGRKAVVITEDGINKVNLVNSVLPEADSIKKSDPFIDREDKAKDEDARRKAKAEKFIDQSKAKFEDENKENDENDEVSDAFIKL